MLGSLIISIGINCIIKFYLAYDSTFISGIGNGNMKSRDEDIKIIIAMQHVNAGEF